LCEKEGERERERVKEGKEDRENNNKIFVV